MALAADPAPPASRPTTASGGSRRRWALALVAVAVVVGVVRGGVVQPERIAGDSMAPTLTRGQVVLVDRVGGLRDVARDDLVAFADPQDGRTTIKRVVAVAGESVMIRDAVLEVDGVPVEEPYVDHESVDALFTPLVVVPDGHVYVLGDARANSRDSREYGPVPVELVDGHVLARLWPPSSLGQAGPGTP